MQIGKITRRVVLSLPLIHSEADRQTPCPVLRVEAKGKKTLFVVDTGSNGNALTNWFAADAGNHYVHRMRRIRSAISPARR